jgi:hypothetical protein
MAVAIMVALLSATTVNEAEKVNYRETQSTLGNEAGD